MTEINIFAVSKVVGSWEKNKGLHGDTVYVRKLLVHSGRDGLITIKLHTNNKSFVEISEVK